MVGLDRLLAALDVTVGAFEILDLAENRRTCPGGHEGTGVVYVLAGVGRLTSVGHPDMALTADVLAILPRGIRGQLAPASGEGAPLIVACGLVRATFGGAAGLFDGLNAPLAACFSDRPMGDAFRTLAAELTAPSVGTRGLTESILKQALILMMRRQTASGHDRSAIPLIGALRDGRLAPALAAMLDRPADPLSLEELARLAGMSRSVFAERFAAAFGRPPIEFLKGVRLGHAARLLATTDLPVKTVASAVGYESRSYFSRAFRSRYAVDPSDYRSAGVAAE